MDEAKDTVDEMDEPSSKLNGIPNAVIGVDL